MSVVARILPHTAVYWAPDTLNVTGNHSYITGREVAVRWQDRVELFVDAQGKERQSSSIVYYDSTDDDLRIDGRLYLGTLASLSAAQQADPTVESGTAKTWRIRLGQDSPNLPATETLGKLFL